MVQAPRTLGTGGGGGGGGTFAAVALAGPRTLAGFSERWGPPGGGVFLGCGDAGT